METTVKTRSNPGSFPWKPWIDREGSNHEPDPGPKEFLGGIRYQDRNEARMEPVEGGPERQNAWRKVARGGVGRDAGSDLS